MHAVRVRTLPLLLSTTLALLSPAFQAQQNPKVFSPISSLVPTGTPDVPAELAHKVLPYTEFRDARLQSWDPNSRSMLIRTRFADVPGIFRVSKPAGAREQLTFLREPSSNALWQPVHGSYFVYMSDAGGAENFQLYREDSKGGGAEQITDGESRNMYAVFSHDGRSLAWASNKRNGADLDLWIASPDQPTSRKMLAAWKGGGLQPQDWSPDGRTVAVLDYVSVAQSTIHVVAVDTGAVSDVTTKLSNGKPVSWKEARFSRDGMSLLALSDLDSDVLRLWRIPLHGGKPVCLTPAVHNDIDEFDLSSDGKVIAYTLNEEGVSSLHVASFPSLQPIQTPALTMGVVEDLHFRPGSHELGFTYTTSTRPADVFSFSPGETAYTVWTKSETGGVRVEDEQKTQLIHWNAKDGETISGFLFEPPARFTGKRPVIIDIHGGPEGQSRPAYLGNYHYFVDQMGVALIYPNVRGSIGYGKRYASLDNGIRREDSVTDIGALLDWIQKQPTLDASRVLIAGMSYGGYMTLSVATQYNDRIAASIDTVGLSNIVTFLERTSPYRRDLRRHEYGDERDPEVRKALEKIAPVNLASNVTRPMFILAGQADPRVPYSESLQMAHAVKAAGAPVWFLGMKDEGHVFQKKANIDYGFLLKIMFVQKYLLAPKAQ